MHLSSKGLLASFANGLTNCVLMYVLSSKGLLASCANALTNYVLMRLTSKGVITIYCMYREMVLDSVSLLPLATVL